MAALQHVARYDYNLYLICYPKTNRPLPEHITEHVVTYYGSTWTLSAAPRLTKFCVVNRPPFPDPTCAVLRQFEQLRDLKITIEIRTEVFDTLLVVAPRLDVLALEFKDTGAVSEEILVKTRAVSRALTRCRKLDIFRNAALTVAMIADAPVLESLYITHDQDITQMLLPLKTAVLKSITCAWGRIGDVASDILPALVRVTTASHSTIRDLSLLDTEVAAVDGIWDSLIAWRNLNKIRLVCTVLDCESEDCLFHYNHTWQLPLPTMCIVHDDGDV